MDFKDQAGKSRDYEPGVVFVKFTRLVTEKEARDIAESLGYVLGKKLTKHNWYRVTVPEGQEQYAIGEFRVHDLVVTAN
ncbi:MAG: hypothetical protein Q7S19_03480 [bacterium]|nr:hypothetical protein [bacterium]